MILQNRSYVDNILSFGSRRIIDGLMVGLYFHRITCSIEAQSALEDININDLE